MQLRTAGVVLGVAVAIGVVAACDGTEIPNPDSVIPDASFEAFGQTNCPCEVSETNLVHVLACDSDQCLLLDGQPRGFHCNATGPVEDPSLCADGGVGRCIPKTCDEIGAVCGAVADRCGHTLQCGMCADDQFCTGQIDLTPHATPYQCFPEVQNVIAFESPNGGIFTIDIDEDIPDIGLVLSSQQSMNVTISGQFAANVLWAVYIGEAQAQITGVPQTFELQEVLPGDATSYVQLVAGGPLAYERCQNFPFSGTYELSEGGTQCP